jgi:molecular chaperone IbpA
VPVIFLLKLKEKKMTGVNVKSLFPRASFVGFDHMFEELDRAARAASDHYPPHNIVRVDHETYLIELAIAGFRRDEVTVEVNDRTLSVVGEHVNQGREYIHKGISAKKFHRTFRLSEYVKVHGADLVDGVLAIQLKVVLPEEKRPRKIEIGYNSEEHTHDRISTRSPELLNEST